MHRILFLGVLIIMSSCTLRAAPVTPTESPQHQDGKFRNPVQMHKLGTAATLKLMWTFLFDKPDSTVPAAAVPVQA